MSNAIATTRLRQRLVLIIEDETRDLYGWRFIAQGFEVIWAVVARNSVLVAAIAVTADDQWPLSDGLIHG